MGNPIRPARTGAKLTAQRFYAALALASAGLALLLLFFRSLWYAAAFFAVLAIATGGMRLLLWCLSHTSGAVQRAARRLYFVGTVLFALFLVTFFTVQIAIALQAHTDASAYQADYLLVLGGGIHGEQPSRTLRLRLETALDYLQKNPDCTLVLCGGQSSGESCSEAYVMQQWLLAHGVSSSQILVEDQSANTVENITNAKQVIAQNTPDRASTAVLSSGFHLLRARHLMQRAGLDPVAVAAPSPWYLRPLFGLREYGSLVFLAATGRW